MPWYDFCAVPVFPPTSYPGTLACSAVPSFEDTIFLKAVFTFCDSSSFNILFIGRLSYEKGIDLLIKSFSECAKDKSMKSKGKVKNFVIVHLTV